MATRISLGGNFNTAASWAVVDATSLLDSEAGNTALTTSYVSSANFAPGAIEVDGIAVKIASRAASPTGTITINLRNTSDSLDVKTVVINVADIDLCTTTDGAGGWYFFKFDAPVTLTDGKNYAVQAKTSSATQVNLYRNGTAGNWSRFLRTTTTGAPAAGDQLNVLGEHTGAGTGNNITITMDQVAASFVDLGSGSDGSVAITVCKRGTLNYGNTAATDYYLKCSGNIIIYSGGTLTIGTVANPIPRNSTAVLEFDPVADGGMGLICRNGSTFIAQGLSRTIGKNVVSGKLNVDTVNNETHFHLDTDSGWLSGDVVGIASTSRTYSECETKILNGDAGAEIINVTVKFGATVHSGISPTQAEVILLTRNVQIRAKTSTIVSYCNFKPTATVDIDWVEFYYLGENVATKRGIEIETSTGSCNIAYSSLWNCEDEAITISPANSNNITLSYNTMYNCPTVGAVGFIYIILATTGTSITIDNNIMIYNAVANNYGINTNDVGIIITNNTIAGINGIGCRLYEFSLVGSFDGNTIHSCAGMGISIANSLGFGSTISNLTIWRMGGTAITANSLAYVNLTNITCFGNTTTNLDLGQGNAGMIMMNLDLDADTTFATTNGIVLGAGQHCPIHFYNCNFGVAGGIKAAHTNDLVVGTGLYMLEFNNCTFGSGVEVKDQSSMVADSYIKSTGHDGTSLGKTWLKYGTILGDTTAGLFRTAAPSQRLTPNDASNKLESGSKKVAVASGNTVTVSAYVRESVVGDGADYNGNRIRLIVKRNDAAGITADTVLATATVNSEGAFELLSGTTIAVTDDAVLEFVVDCDGTTGWINVDDWSTS